VSKTLVRANTVFYNNKIIIKKPIVPSRYFENSILIIILLSSILIGIDNPLRDPNSKIQRVIYYIDAVFTIVFLIEAIIKIIALGFFKNHLNNENAKPYITNAWNILDFAVVCASMTDFIVNL
jgi:hypothetical protein